MIGRNPLRAYGSIFAAAAACLATDAFARGDTAEYLMSDFESGQILGTPLNGYWYTFTDRNTATSVDTVYGNSRITSFDSTGFPFTDSMGYYDARTFPLGRSGDSGSHSLRIAYELGDRKLSCGAACEYDPYLGFGMRFTTNADTLNLTGATHIAFWAKAEKDSVVVDVSVGTRDTTTNAADYSQVFVIGTEWKQYAIRLEPSAQFRQPGWAARKPFNPAVATGVGFGINRGSNKAVPINGVLIDDLTIRNWVYVDPNTIPDGIAFRRSKAPGMDRLRTFRGAGGLHVALPERYRGQGGEVQAVDARGSIRARAAFGREAREAVLPLEGTAGQGGLLLRVIPAP